MSTMNERFNSIPIQFAGIDPSKGPDGVPKRVQVLRVGSFSYQDDSMDEPIELDITQKVLASMKKNFDDKVRGVDLAFDYSHRSADEAAGWFTGLILEGDGLWAEVDWTKSAREALAEKKFRYVSADFNWDYQDNETGKKFGPTLNGAALTNRPFVKNMAPAMALTEGGSKMSKTNDGKSLQEQFDEMKASLATLSDENKSLKAEKAKLEEATKLSEKKSEFDVMLAEGKVVEAQRDPFMKNDFKTFASKAKAVNLSERGDGTDPGAGTDDTIQTGDGPKNHAEVVAEVRKRTDKLCTDKKAQGITLSRAEAYGIVLGADDKLSIAFHKGPEAPAPRHPRRKAAAA